MERIRYMRAVLHRMLHGQLGGLARKEHPVQAEEQQLAQEEMGPQGRDPVSFSYST